MSRQIGQTRSAGFQVGVRRTLPIPLDAAWRWITSPSGMAVWLGSGTAPEVTRGATYRLADGSVGEMRVVKHGSHLRVSWQAEGWPRPSLIQVRVIARGSKTTVAYHQENLPGHQEREARRGHFAAALDALEIVARRI